MPSQLIWSSIGNNFTMECNVEAYPRSVNYWIRGDGIKKNKFIKIIKIKIRIFHFVQQENWSSPASSLVSLKFERASLLHEWPSPSTRLTNPTLASFCFHYLYRDFVCGNNELNIFLLNAIQESTAALQKIHWVKSRVESTSMVLFYLFAKMI